MPEHQNPSSIAKHGLREVALALFYAGQRVAGEQHDAAWDHTVDFAQWLETSHPNGVTP